MAYGIPSSMPPFSPLPIPHFPRRRAAEGGASFLYPLRRRS